MKKILPLLIIIALVFSGCIHKKTSEEPIERKDFIYAVDKIPKNPLIIEEKDLKGEELQMALFEGLLSYDLNGDVTYGLAENYTKSKDGLSYNFKLRNDIFFSDGTSITSKDFVDFFKEFFKCSGYEDIKDKLKCIFGVKEYMEGSISFEKVGIQCISDKELKINLNYPYENLTYVLAHPSLSLRKLNGNWDWKEDVKEVITTGPYSFEGYNNESLIIKKNEFYYDKKNVSLEKITIQKMDSSEKALAALKSDKIDLFVNPPLQLIDSLREYGNIQTFYTNKMYRLVFNYNSDKELNSSFRKAVYENIYRIRGVENINGIVIKPSLSFFSKNDKDKECINHFESDAKLEWAKQKKNLTLIYEAKDLNEIIANNIKKAFKEKFNIDMNIKPLESDELKSHIDKKEFDMFLQEWVPLYNSYYGYIEEWDKSNDYGYYNAKVDENLYWLLICQKEEEKEKYMENLKNLIQSECIYVPMFFKHELVCKNSKISNVNVDYRGCIVLKNLKIVEKNIKE